MEKAVKTNCLAVISFVSGLMVLLSLGFYWALYWIGVSPSAVPMPEAVNRVWITLMDWSVPVRNLSAAAALLTGILGLREIKKRGGAEKGKGLCWAGVVLGAGWMVFGLLVGLIFLLAETLAPIVGD